MNDFVNFILSEKMIHTLVTILISLIIVTLINRAKDKIEVTNASSIRTKKRNTIVTLVANILIYIALKDIIAGCNIILDDYFVVGDLVTFNDFTGIVTEFGLKSTKIKGFDGTELTVANREISHIKNISAEDTAWWLDIPVAYEVSEKQVATVMKSIIKKIVATGLTIEEPEYLGINGFMESNINYLLLAKCKSKDRYVLRREILKIVKEEFDSKGIKIPYPQVEIHNGKKF